MNQLAKGQNFKTMFKTLQNLLLYETKLLKVVSFLIFKLFHLLFFYALEELLVGPVFCYWLVFESDTCVVFQMAIKT